MHFSWDEAKAKSNKTKHGVSFEVSKEVFNDPCLIVQMDNSTDIEQRFHALGMVKNQLILLVVHTLIAEGSRNEIIRIISARKATKIERQAYENSRR